MPKPIGSPRNLTAVQDQWETVQVSCDVGVNAVYHRRQVTRDGGGVLIGIPGPWISVSVAWADLPVPVRNALTTAANHGDSL